METPIQYIFINKGLDMSPGKLAAQVAHAACMSQKYSEPKAVKAWYDNNSFAKVTLQAKNESQLLKIIKLLSCEEILTFPIYDEGRTELEPNTLTTVGVQIIDKEKYQHIFKKYSLFK